MDHNETKAAPNNNPPVKNERRQSRGSGSMSYVFSKALANKPSADGSQSMARPTMPAGWGRQNSLPACPPPINSRPRGLSRSNTIAEEQSANPVPNNSVAAKSSEPPKRPENDPANVRRSSLPAPRRSEPIVSVPSTEDPDDGVKLGGAFSRLQRQVEFGEPKKDVYADAFEAYKAKQSMKKHGVVPKDLQSKYKDGSTVPSVVLPKNQARPTVETQQPTVDTRRPSFGSNRPYVPNAVFTIPPAEKKQAPPTRKLSSEVEDNVFTPSSSVPSSPVAEAAPQANGVVVKRPSLPSLTEDPAEVRIPPVAAARPKPAAKPRAEAPTPAPRRVSPPSVVKRESPPPVAAKQEKIVISPAAEKILQDILEPSNITNQTVNGQPVSPKTAKKEAMVVAEPEPMEFRPKKQSLSLEKPEDIHDQPAMIELKKERKERKMSVQKGHDDLMAAIDDLDNFDFDIAISSTRLSSASMQEEESTDTNETPSVMEIISMHDKKKDSKQEISSTPAIEEEQPVEETKPEEVIETFFEGTNLSVAEGSTAAETPVADAAGESAGVTVENVVDDVDEDVDADNVDELVSTNAQITEILSEVHLQQQSARDQTVTAADMVTESVEPEVADEQPLEVPRSVAFDDEEAVIVPSVDKHESFEIIPAVVDVEADDAAASISEESAVATETKAAKIEKEHSFELLAPASSPPPITAETTAAQESLEPVSTPVIEPEGTINAKVEAVSPATESVESIEIINVSLEDEPVAAAGTAGEAAIVDVSDSEASSAELNNNSKEIQQQPPTEEEERVSPQLNGIHDTDEVDVNDDTDDNCTDLPQKKDSMQAFASSSSSSIDLTQDDDDLETHDFDLKTGTDFGGSLMDEIQFHLDSSPTSDTTVNPYITMI